MKCLHRGLTECPDLPLDFSLDLMGLLDEIRINVRFVYPGQED